jgi:hypothetical protein
MKGRTGYVICIADCPVGWASRLQHEISNSIMEAKYNTLSISMREVSPFRNLVIAVAEIVDLDLETPTFQVTIHEDNNCVLILANREPRRVMPRTKFYAIKTHWFRSKLKPE